MSLLGTFKENNQEWQWEQNGAMCQNRLSQYSMELKMIRIAVGEARTSSSQPREDFSTDVKEGPISFDSEKQEESP